MPADYITSERFIHDDLLVRASAVVRQLFPMWRKHQHIRTVLLCWPGEPIKSTGGEEIDGVCALDLHEVPHEEQPQVIRLMAGRVQAYGVFFVEQQLDVVRACFETKHGSRVWALPIRRHGDVLVLEAPDVTTDGLGLGLLWTP